MTEHLLLKPDKAQFLQQLYEEDFQNRVEMCQMPLPLLTEPRNKNNVFCSDEVAFHLNDLVSKHKVRYWNEENPQAIIETVMQSVKVRVCCSISEKITGFLVLIFLKMMTKFSRSVKRIFRSRIEKIAQGQFCNFSRGWSINSF